MQQVELDTHADTQTHTHTHTHPTLVAMETGPSKKAQRVLKDAKKCAVRGSDSQGNSCVRKRECKHFCVCVCVCVCVCLFLDAINKS